jgi:hypothetical protein
MGLSTEPFNKAGVSLTLDELEQLVMAAAEQLLPRQPAMAATTELSVDEVEFLQRAGVDLSDLSLPVAGLASPLARTTAEYAVLLASSLSPTQIAERIGQDESRVRQRINHHTLYAVREGRGWRVPVFQLDRTGHALLPGLNLIIPHMYDAHLVEVVRWFILPQVDLEDANDQPLSPRDWLLNGNDPRVAAQVAEEFDGLG